MREAPEFERMLVHSGLHADQVLVLGDPVRAADPVRHPAGRPGAAVEAVADGPRVAGQVGRLHRGQGGDVLLHRHRRRAVDGGQEQRQEARPARGDAARPRAVRLRRQGRGGRRQAGQEDHRAVGAAVGADVRRSRSRDCEAHVSRGTVTEITTEAELREALGGFPVRAGGDARSGRRCTRCRSSGCRRRRSACSRRRTPTGNCDASPKGDPAGQLIHVLDPQHGGDRRAAGQQAGRRVPQHPVQPARRDHLADPRAERHAADQRAGPAGAGRAVLRRAGGARASGRCWRW